MCARPHIWTQHAPRRGLPGTPSNHSFVFFFFNDRATPEISPLPPPDPLPIYPHAVGGMVQPPLRRRPADGHQIARPVGVDRKSTRLNSSHLVISYAVFCL